MECFSGEHFLAWSRADEAFRSGRPAAEAALGAPYFEWLAQHPEAAENFNRAMASYSELRAETLLALPWDCELVVDVGGGTGRLLAGVLAANSGLRGIVYDLPYLRAGAEATIADAGLAQRCSFIAGDFFESIPAGGDVYVISKILHDWDDDACERILRACRTAAGPSARLLIVEGVVDADGDRLLTLRDLHMLVLLGGAERTEEEWRLLLERGGFDLVGIRLGQQPVLEARPLASHPTPDGGS